MKHLFILLLAVLSIQVQAADRLLYPKAPNLEVTPGALCTTPDTYRYPEQIAYCERNVNSFLKESIFFTYRRELGYSLSGDRADYKVDHFIPLCAGGSNDKSNLWPQHMSVYKITDPLEAMGCEKLSDGLITQKELIELIVKAKLDLTQVPKILKYIKKLR